MLEFFQTSVMINYCKLMRIEIQTIVKCTLITFITKQGEEIFPLFTTVANTDILNSNRNVMPFMRKTVTSV